MLSNALLFAKARLVRTPLEPFAIFIQRALNAGYRRKTPELWEFHQEDDLLPIVLKKILREDSCCVDVGCHIGSFLSRIFKLAPNGKHFAFEPVPRKITWLKRTFPEATIIQAAVSDADGTALFAEDKERPGYSRLAIDGNGYSVPTVTLDECLRHSARIDFIKIDTEGAELKVLCGATETVKKFKPTILFECGSEYFLTEKGLSRRDLYDFIVVQLDYKIFTFSDFISGKLPLAFEQFLQCGLYPFRAFNFLAIPR
jgi:FkbM family methyltransferase